MFSVFNYIMLYKCGKHMHIFGGRFYFYFRQIFFWGHLFHSSSLDMRWLLPARRYMPHWLSIISYSMRACGIIVIIVFITKFSIVIGSPLAYFSRNQRAITWVSNYRYPIWTLCNWIPVIEYPRDLQVNYARFNGFRHNDLFSAFFKTYEKCYRRFRWKEVLKRHSKFRNLL